MTSRFPLFPDTPFFAAPIQNTTVRLGDTARLTCIVEKLGPYQVAWVHQASGAVLSVGDRVLTSNTRVTVTREQRSTWVLVLANVTRSDAGQYMCQVSTNPPRKLFGFLSIVEPPVFEWHSQIPRVTEGKTAVLECHARGIPSPTILWRREDNEDIRINASISTPSFKGSVLTLYDASAFTAGAYVCVASNGHPPSVSRILKLKVIHAPLVEFVSSKPYVWVRQGELIILSCRYAAFPQPQVVFHRENYYGRQNLSVSNFEIKRILQQFPFTHLMSLTLARVVDSDFGNYSCVVTNELGQAYDSLVLGEIPTTTTTTTSTTTTMKPSSTTPEIMGRAPIPLRDGSFTSNANNESSQISVKTTTDANGGELNNTQKTNDQHQNSWSKKIARINISENSRNNAESSVLVKELLLLITLGSLLIWRSYSNV